MKPSRRFTGTKVLFALLVLIGVGLMSAEQWPALVAVLSLVWGAAALAGVSGRTLRRRLLQFLPLVIGFAVATYFSQPGANAGAWVIAISLRCLIALLVGTWLVQVTTAREFLALLERWWFPPAFLVALSFMLRYLVVLWEEHERLRLAQLARAGGPASGWARWQASIERLGVLLVRGLDRAERTHRALLARGWDGTATWRA